MKDCTTCKYDVTRPEDNICKQGHYRPPGRCDLIRIPVQNCHAWEEKPKCWCEERMVKDGYLYQVNREIIVFHFCPQCGRQL